MMSDDAKYLKRKIRSGSIDVHPTEKALIVNYELEALILGEKGDKMLGDKKEHQKIIRLNSLNAKTDCAALAREVVEKCSLIHQAKINEVEHLIHYLKNRKENSTNNDKNSPRSLFSDSFITDKPNINNMDMYVENLYEETYEKVVGSSMILKLAQNPNNLQELASNESALSALARVFREDWKKNIELATNISYIFNCFSAYTQFHPIIVQYKIGSLCMELIDHELRRYEAMKESMDAKKLNSPSGRSRSPSGNEKRKRQSMIPIGKKRSESVNRMTCSEIDLRKSLPTTPVNPYKSLSTSLHELDNKREDESINKQDELFRISVNLLYNLAENTKIEEKMRKRNISKMLSQMLDRSSIDLVALCLKFLKKLSVFKENKDDMVAMNLVEQIGKVLNINKNDIQIACYKILYNLSFDLRVREQILNEGLFPKLVAALSKYAFHKLSELNKILFTLNVLMLVEGLLRFQAFNGLVEHPIGHHIDLKQPISIQCIQQTTDDDNLSQLSLGIMYHLSMDDKVKSMFTYTECIPMLIELLLENKSSELAVALGINLALNKRNAELMAEENRLQKLLEKAFKTQDELLIKMIHNMVMSEGVKPLMVEFVGDIAKAITTCESEAFVVECLGILGNLTMPELDFSVVLQNCGLVAWLLEKLQPTKSEDDLLLAAVVLLGTAACDEDCAILIGNSGILLALIELLKVKQVDDEMVLQIVYVFYQMARHDDSRDILIKDTVAADYLIDLLQDKNKEIAKVCDACLDIISECNVDWKRRIMLNKFRFHNANWLETVDSQAMDKAAFGTIDDELPPFLNTNFMQNTMLYQPDADDLNDLSDLEDNEDEMNKSRSRFSRDLDIELIDDFNGTGSMSSG